MFEKANGVQKFRLTHKTVKNTNQFIPLALACFVRENLCLLLASVFFFLFLYFNNVTPKQNRQQLNNTILYVHVRTRILVTFGGEVKSCRVV